MRVFVTGATGFIGTAVVKELISAGNQVIGLCRSDDKAPALAVTGAEVYRGSIADPDTRTASRTAPLDRMASSISPSTMTFRDSSKTARTIGV